LHAAQSEGVQAEAAASEAAETSATDTREEAVGEKRARAEDGEEDGDVDGAESLSATKAARASGDA
jgi:hypothetical protein